MLPSFSMNPSRFFFGTAKSSGTIPYSQTIEGASFLFSVSPSSLLLYGSQPWLPDSVSCNLVVPLACSQHSPTTARLIAYLNQMDPFTHPRVQLCLPPLLVPSPMVCPAPRSSSKVVKSVLSGLNDHSCCLGQLLSPLSGVSVLYLWKGQYFCPGIMKIKWAHVCRFSEETQHIISAGIFNIVLAGFVMAQTSPLFLARHLQAHYKSQDSLAYLSWHLGRSHASLLSLSLALLIGCSFSRPT